MRRIVCICTLIIFCLSIIGCEEKTLQSICNDNTELKSEIINIFSPLGLKNLQIKNNSINSSLYLEDAFENVNDDNKNTILNEINNNFSDKENELKNTIKTIQNNEKLENVKLIVNVYYKENIIEQIMINDAQISTKEKI